MPHIIAARGHIFYPHYHESGSIYLTHALRSLAVSLVGVFIPIYVFQLSLNSEYFSENVILDGLTWVLLYFLLRTFCSFVTALLSPQIIFARLGFKKSLIVGAMLLCLQLIILSAASSNYLFLIPAAIFGGIETILYWLPYHLFFLRRINNKGFHHGHDMSIRMLIVKATSGVAPFIGGLITALWGFKVLFIAGLGLAALHWVPLVLSVYEGPHVSHKIKDLLKNYVFNPKLRKITLSISGMAVEDLVYTVLWSILLFSVLNDYSRLGFITSVSWLISLIFVIWTGVKIDKGNARKIHTFGVGVNSVLYLVRLLFPIIPVYYLVDILDRTNANFLALPQLSAIYEKAGRLGDGNFIIYREMVIYFTMMVTVAFCLLFLLFISSWKILLLLGIFGSLLSLVIQWDDN